MIKNSKFYIIYDLKTKKKILFTYNIQIHKTYYFRFNYLNITIKMMNQQKQVTLIIKSGEYFTYNSQELDFYKINYHPEFDPNDFFAAARLLYQLSYQTKILTLEQYVEILYKSEFKELLKVIIKGDVIKSTKDEKIILIEFSLNSGFKSQIIPFLLQRKEEALPKKRFALLITEPQYYDKYVNIMEALHLGIYKQENEDWEIHLAIEKQFPKLEGLEGIVITGSTSSAYDVWEDWKEPLFNFLKEADKLQIKMLGICFGHQILAHCLGGEARKMTHVPRMQVGRLTLLSGLEFAEYHIKNLNVYQIHGDYVFELPKNSEPLMSAQHCQNYAFKSSHLLGLQFHPEFNPLILLYFFWDFEDQQLKEVYLKQCYDSFKQGEDQQLAIWAYIINFLKNS
ncbi:unnamed protein product [Paramecium sonneborni]|uniref:Glutamine amidotransferase domain-containing protein n=1 Tax=Paramecium sonneborni TaxID=65129 RepID=A0A8S1RI81_9CILI|nr:unnamed protein product [Paramecium sonneborni]